VVLSASDKQDGCVFIDVGSSVTMILIYKDYVLKHIARVDFGGDDITQGLAQLLDIPFDTAEEVKRSYGSILEDDVQGDRDILVRTDYGHISLKSQAVCQACLKKTDILIGKIREAILNSGLKDQILGAVTLAGGAALLSGFTIRLQEALQRSVKLGQVQGAQKTLKNVVAFSSVLGLAHHGYRVHNESIRKSPEDGALMKRWTEKVKILYQQYF
jgi:cell division protein FtsA